MKLTRMAVLSVVFGLSSLANADFIGLKGDISYWNFDGHTRTEHSVPGIATDLNRTYEMDRQGTVQLSAAFEHPVPLLPNVKLKYVNLDNESRDSAFSSKTELTNTDLILYYEILDNIISADIGAGLAYLDGTTRISTAGLYTDHDISGSTPFLYAQAGAKLPFTGLSANAELIVTDINDTKMTDAQAELQYDFVKSIALDIGAKVGYRIMKIEIEESKNENIEYEFKGPYIGLAAHF
ncbi:TIGR04219 family outer membrane beta-barrel protein [Acinetobacter sp. WCHAc010052]|uniref:TIGR04219 family outer membrane beta-barrel protein n=1 Tax=Acinetobacter sp. WCHAc010052 TaxID=2004647 RepID=UPI000B3C129D|nr:TIGR04219 family outer membrane beta-barrel protein [Acinetobacter sp. WCHAc010052]AXY58666.1 TIGR04219 family outer membrane beta-barrel protein [Acinetobacter sp. WCHAc010052]